MSTTIAIEPDSKIRCMSDLNHRLTLDDIVKDKNDRQSSVQSMSNTEVTNKRLLNS